MLSGIISYLENIAHTVPLEIFVPTASFIEEVIAPIPSPLVMVLSGSIAGSQNLPLIYLLWLAFIGAIGKTIGAWILYFVADKLEDVIVKKYGKFFGVSHTHIENIGKKLNGKWQDNVFLFVARALPIIPSAPVSIACGLIKINLKTYLTSTFLGTYVRNLIYLYLGYVSYGNYKQIADGFEGVESLGQILIFLALVGLVLYAYRKRKHHMAS